MAVRDGFLTSSAWRALAGCAAARRERGDFAAARVGAGRTLERREEIRGDLTCWLTPPLFDPEVQLLAMLEGLRLELNRGGIPGLFDLELHYAWYPPGAGYARHVDRPENRDARLISLVLYLNEDWAPGDGGALRCFDAVRPPRDLQPIGGRLVAAPLSAKGSSMRYCPPRTAAAPQSDGLVSRARRLTSAPIACGSRSRRPRTWRRLAASAQRAARGGAGCGMNFAPSRWCTMLQIAVGTAHDVNTLQTEANALTVARTFEDLPGRGAAIELQGCGRRIVRHPHPPSAIKSRRWRNNWA